MENNTFFSTVLHSLGYVHYTTGARIAHALEGNYPPNSPELDGFMAWGHQVLLVDIATPGAERGGEEGSRTKCTKYLVDIGLGAQGSLEPIELREGAIAKGAPGVTLRLVRRGLADFTSGQEMWVLEFKTWKRSGTEPKDAELGVEEGWKAAYAFEDREWLPQDFVPLSFNQSVNPRSMFVKTLVLTKCVLSEDGKEVRGQVTLVGKEFSRRLKVGDGEGGWMVEKEVLRVCENEEERVEGLERWFGVVLRMDERRGIKGLPSALGERGLEFDRGR